MPAIINVFKLNALGHLELEPQEVCGPVFSNRSYNQQDFIPQEIRDLAREVRMRGIFSTVMKCRKPNIPAQKDQSHLVSYIRPDKRVYGNRSPLEPVQFNSITYGGPLPVTVDPAFLITRIIDMRVHLPDELYQFGTQRDQDRHHDLRLEGVGKVLFVVAEPQIKGRKAEFYYAHLDQAKNLGLHIA